MEQEFMKYERDRLSQYRLILDTPTLLKKKIAHLRIEIERMFKGISLKVGQPFIFLSSFFGYESDQETIINNLSKISLGSMPFKLKFSGFGTMNESELFIRVAENPLLVRVFNKLGEQNKGVRRAQFNRQPRISLVRELTHWQMQQCWPVFRYRIFRSQFVVDRMILLKQFSETSSWKVERVFLFENQYIIE